MREDIKCPFRLPARPTQRFPALDGDDEPSAREWGVEDADECLIADWLTEVEARWLAQTINEAADKE